ncbi:MAG TPA: hypothetical protein DCE42_25335 [Myxococcales bacterium]|nr:hypothetical protein [Deltaproteobacteria bacterium]MBU49678.1 hypothetical protein [Deltaproteobacteria bacterium]HAA58111.1 hypothetical protein [Myxococcales bacterium]|tara:strand:- start:12394 stop:13221 length:828 start_codon:yes stop_codon:yes gene_type:complete
MTEQPTSTNTKPHIDVWTLAAIAAVAFILQNILHEGLGHAGACLTVQCKPLALSTSYFQGDKSQTSDWGIRWIAFAGSFVNAIVGLLCWWLLRIFRKASAHLRLFLWLSMTVNLLSAAGYPLFSGVLGVGDWANMVKGWQPAWLWRTGNILFGLVIYMLCAWLCLKELSPMLGRTEEERIAHGNRLMMWSYLFGGAAATIGALLNPVGFGMILTSAASTFGANSALTWMPNLLEREAFKSGEHAPIELTRSLPWLIAATLLTLVHIFVLGPSIHF